MKKSRFFISLLLAGVLLFAQVSAVLASPTVKADTLVTGMVQTITLETDANTALTTVLITVKDESGDVQTVRVSLETAIELGIVTLDGDGNPIINQLVLGQQISIDRTTIIADEEQHPVGSALSTFFSDIEGLDYSVIMDARDMGNGFGLIAQALWLTRKLEGTAEDFLAILDAKKNNDYSSFVFEDGSSPKSWGELKKAIMDGDKKGNLGLVVSNKDNGNGNPAHQTNKEKDKEKDKDKSNNGNGNGKKP
jgi:hypothetical protein